MQAGEANGAKEPKLEWFWGMRSGKASFRWVRAGGIVKGDTVDFCVAAVLGARTDDGPNGYCGVTCVDSGSERSHGRGDYVMRQERRVCCYKADLVGCGAWAI